MNRTKMQSKCEFVLCLSWNPHLLPVVIRALGSWAFGITLNCTAGFARSPVCRQQIMRFLSFHNIMRTNSYNKSLISFFLYILLVVFLWRTLLPCTNASYLADPPCVLFKLCLRALNSTAINCSHICLMNTSLRTLCCSNIYSCY